MYPVIDGKTVKTAVVNGKRRKLRCGCTGSHFSTDREKYGRAYDENDVNGRLDFPKLGRCDNCHFYPWVIL